MAVPCFKTIVYLLMPSPYCKPTVSAIPVELRIFSIFTLQMLSAGCIYNRQSTCMDARRILGFVKLGACSVPFSNHHWKFSQDWNSAINTINSNSSVCSMIDDHRRKYCRLAVDIVSVRDTLLQWYSWSAVSEYRAAKSGFSWLPFVDTVGFQSVKSPQIRDCIFRNIKLIFLFDISTN